MKSQLEWIQERYPHIKGLPVADSITVDYLVYAVTELSQCLAALTPAAPAEERVIVWPDSPKRCKCADGFMPSGDDSFTCGRCEGLKF